MKTLKMILMEKMFGKPLTKSFPELISKWSPMQLHEAAAEMGYTRRAVNHALRKSGVKQNKSRKDVA